MQGVRRTLIAGLAAALVVPLAGAAAGAATPVGCDLDLVIPAGPEDPIQITTDGMTDDASRIVFSSARGHDGPSDGNDELFLYNTADGEITQLTDTPNGTVSNSGARFADGGDLVFYERRSFHTQVRVIDLTTMTDTAVMPAFAPGRLLATAADAPVAIFSAEDDLDDNTDGGLEAFRYEGGVIERMTNISAIPGKGGNTSSWLPEAALSPDGSVAAISILSVLEPSIFPHYTHVFEGGDETPLGSGEDLQLIGEQPRLLYTDGARYTHGQTLDRFQAHVYERTAPTWQPQTQIAPDAVLDDAGAAGEQLLVRAAYGEIQEDDSFLRSERHTLATGRRVPLRGRIAGAVVEVGATDLTGASADADVSRVAFVNQNRVILAECSSFSDVKPSQPFAEDIEWAFAEGITTGSPDGSYRPANEVTREAMAAFLHRLTGQPDPAPPATAPFTDVGLDHPFLLDIQWAVDQSITTGFADGTYRPKQPVRRDAMAAFLHRVTGDEPPTLPGAPTFTDVPATHTFYEDIEWASAEAITTGFADGTYRPANAVTRAAMAAFLHRTDEHLP
jgi:hypothetical protein